MSDSDSLRGSGELSSINSGAYSGAGAMLGIDHGSGMATDDDEFGPSRSSFGGRSSGSNKGQPLLVTNRGESSSSSSTNALEMEQRKTQAAIEAARARELGLAATVFESDGSESADMDLYVVEPTKGLSCPSPRIVSVSLVCFFLFAIAIASLVVGVLQLELDPSYSKFESCEELEESFEDNAPPEDGAPWLALNAPWDVVCPHYGCYNDDHTSSGYTPRDERCLGFGLKPETIFGRIQVGFESESDVIAHDNVSAVFYIHNKPGAGWDEASCTIELLALDADSGNTTGILPLDFDARELYFHRWESTGAVVLVVLGRVPGTETESERVVLALVDPDPASAGFMTVVRRIEVEGKFLEFHVHQGMAVVASAYEARSYPDQRIPRLWDAANGADGEDIATCQQAAHFTRQIDVVQFVTIWTYPLTGGAAAAGVVSSEVIAVPTATVRFDPVAGTYLVGASTYSTRERAIVIQVDLTIADGVTTFAVNREYVMEGTIANSNSIHTTEDMVAVVVSRGTNWDVESHFRASSVSVVAYSLSDAPDHDASVDRRGEALVVTDATPVRVMATGRQIYVAVIPVSVVGEESTAEAHRRRLLDESEDGAVAGEYSRSEELTYFVDVFTPLDGSSATAVEDVEVTSTLMDAVIPDVLEAYDDDALGVWFTWEDSVQTRYARLDLSNPPGWGEVTVRLQGADEGTSAVTALANDPRGTGVDSVAHIVGVPITSFQRNCELSAFEGIKVQHFGAAVATPFVVHNNVTFECTNEERTMAQPTIPATDAGLRRMVVLSNPSRYLFLSNSRLTIYTDDWSGWDKVISF